MAAGLGFKDFTTGEVLTAADVDGYLMQGVWVFASAAARDAAVTSPQEGNFAYLKDTNVTTYYTGSAWANLDTTGMTNPMTTTGDMIYSSSGSTPARLGLGTANQQLRVNAGATAPEWFTPAAGTFVGCKVTNSANLTINAGTDTAVTWDTESFDTDSMHSTSSNTSRITIASGKDGYYQINALIKWKNIASTSTVRQLRLRKNGTQINLYSLLYPQNDDAYQSFNDVYNLVAGDYIEFYVFANTSSSTEILSDSSFSIYKVG